MHILYFAHIFDLKWKIAEVLFVIFASIFISLFWSVPLLVVSLFFVPFIVMNVLYIAYMYYKTGTASFEPEFIPNKIEMIFLLVVFITTSVLLLYSTIPSKQHISVIVVFGILFCLVDLYRYFTFYKAYKQESDFHQDEHSVAFREWEEASRIFHIANIHHSNERNLFALIWWFFSVGRFYRVMEKLRREGKSNSSPEYIVAENYMKAAKIAFRSEIVRFFNVENSRRIFSEATDHVSEANVKSSLFECDFCHKIYHRKELIRFLNKQDMAENEVCEECYNRYWTNCEDCGRTIRDEQEIDSGGCVFCQTNKQRKQENENIKETETSDLVSDACEILEIEEPITEEKVNSAYRDKVQTVHPDKGGSEEEFKNVTESKEVLLEHLSEEGIE